MKSSQLYAPPLVVLAALGTVYGSGMMIIYYVNVYVGVPLMDLWMSFSFAILCLAAITAAEKHQMKKDKKESVSDRKSFQLQVLSLWKYTITPIVALSCVLQLGWPGALLGATSFVVILKVFRTVLLKLCWAGCPSPGEQMRVLLSGDSFPPKLDGVQNFARNTIQALVRDGHKVHVFCSNGSPTTHLAPENYGATVTRGPGVEVQPKHKITLPSPHFLVALMRFKPHIIQFFDFTPCAIFLVPFLWWLGIPVVISHHSRIDLYAAYVPGFIGDYSPQVVRAACEVVFPLVTGHLLIDGSQKDQSWFQGHSNTRFWSTGCDLEFFHPSKASQETRAICSNGRPDLPLVVFVGRLSPEKQVDKLIDLVKVTNLPGQPELCRFAIIGHGDSWESIHKEIGDRPDVYMPGAVTGEQLASTVASADIFFSPTVTGTLDLVFIESQAAGIAVVGPRAVAVPLVVTDGVNGRLYDPLDMQDAKRAIQDIAAGQLDKMKAEARKNAEANFTWSKSSDEAIQFYKDVLQYFQNHRWVWLEAVKVRWAFEYLSTPSPSTGFGRACQCKALSATCVKLDFMSEAIARIPIACLFADCSICISIEFECFCPIWRDGPTDCKSESFEFVEIETAFAWQCLWDHVRPLKCQCNKTEACRVFTWRKLLQRQPVLDWWHLVKHNFRTWKLARARQGTDGSVSAYLKMFCCYIL